MTKTSLLTKIPENKNFLQSTKFTFVFPTLPFLRFFGQTCTIPGVYTNPPPQNVPHALVYRHGDTLQYDQLTISTLIDEDIQIWEEIYLWLQALTKPQQYEQYNKFKNSESKLYHDGILTINTNANIPNIRILFKNCHPISLGAINFDTTTNAENTLTIDITFRYDYYEFERIKI